MTPLREGILPVLKEAHDPGQDVISVCKAVMVGRMSLVSGLNIMVVFHAHTVLR